MKALEEEILYTNAEGLLLKGWRWGEGHPQVLFSPGNGFNVRSYLPALRPLISQTELHAIHYRGQGGSTVPADLPDWKPLLADMKAYIEEQMKPPVILAGHSMGCVLGLMLASAAPHLVKGLLMTDPVMIRGQDAPEGNVIRERTQALIEQTKNRKALWADKKSASEELRQKGVYAAWAEEAFEEFLIEGLKETENGEVTLSTPPWLEAKVYETHPREKAWENLKVQSPAVIIKGTQSPVTSEPVIQALADELPISVVLYTPGTHTLCQEHPEKTGAVLSQGLQILLREHL